MASVLIPLADGCEELEAVTIIDLLRRAGIEVITAGLKPGPVKASRGTVLVPDVELDEVLERAFDMIVLPGGMPGADHLDRDDRIQALVKSMAAADKYVGAICAAPKVLASAGLLRGRRATSFPGALDGLELEDTTLTTNTVETDGKIVTSRGPGTAMDFALDLIEKLAGHDKRTEVEGPLQRPAA
jgi:4-methyl-5(b-hydroxyethyl)-thiazole monophosphate biosynthesis